MFQPTMDEPVLEAELIEEWPGKKANSSASSNAALGATIAVVLVFLLLKILTTLIIFTITKILMMSLLTN